MGEVPQELAPKPRHLLQLPIGVEQLHDLLLETLDDLLGALAKPDLPRLVGAARAHLLLLTGRLIDAAYAERIGLVAEVVPGDALLAAAMGIADEIIANSPFGVWMTKEVMWSNLEVASQQAAIDLENRTQVLASQTADAMEAMASFLQKRPPKFRFG